VTSPTAHTVPQPIKSQVPGPHPTTSECLLVRVRVLTLCEDKRLLVQRVVLVALNDGEGLVVRLVVQAVHNGVGILVPHLVSALASSGPPRWQMIP